MEATIENIASFTSTSELLVLRPMSS
jgi:hypothetical protein